MIELYNEVKEIADKELARANKKFPLFRSHHEGLAIIEEEIFEANMEMEDILDAFTEFKDHIFLDDALSAKRDEAKDLRDAATRSACEFIQVAAMCQKFLDCFHLPKVEIPDADKFAPGKLDVKINLCKDQKIISIPAEKYEEVMKVIKED